MGNVSSSQSFSIFFRHSNAPHGNTNQIKNVEEMLSHRA